MRFRTRVMIAMVALVTVPNALTAGAHAAGGEAASPAAAGIPHHEPAPRVSRGKAVLASLLLPGLGQSLSGHHGRAKFFYGTETAIWTTAGAYRVVSHMRFQDVREFARIRADADPGDQSDDYFQLLADYPSSDIFNIAIRDEARIIHPDDREAQLAYIEANSIQGDHAWHWPDYDTRRTFQLIRHDALSARRRSVLVTGWAVVNRLVSAIEAARSYPHPRATSSRMSDAGATGDAGDGSTGFTFQAGLTDQRGEPAAGIGISRSF